MKRKNSIRNYYMQKKKIKLHHSNMDNNPYKRANSRGFTYLEILIAVVILGLAILPSINVFSTFKKYTIHAEDIQLALRLAQEKVEDYKTLPYIKLKTLVETMPSPESNVQVSAQKNSAGIAYTDFRYQKFKRRVTLSYLGGNNEMVLIKVYVWWYDGMFAAGDQRYVVLQALVCKDVIL